MDLAHCRFCGHFAGANTDPVDAPWMRDAEYCALISKGALVPGWSLLCPSQHRLSMAADYQRREFWDFAGAAVGAVRARYGEVRMFEHGAGYAGSPTGCGTDHAHLHVVPLSFDLTIEAMRFDPALNWQPCFAAEVSRRAAGHEYLFVSDRYSGDATSGLLCLLDSPTSQFFRRVVAQRLGLREFFDYRRHPMLDIARRSVSDLRSDVRAGAPVDAE